MSFGLEKTNKKLGINRDKYDKDRYHVCLQFNYIVKYGQIFVF